MARPKAHDTRIVNHGRRHHHHISGGIPKPALVAWAAGAVGQAALEDPDYFLATLNKNTPDEFIKWCRGLPYQDRDRAATRGTEVHHLAEQLTLGHDIQAPPAFWSGQPSRVAVVGVIAERPPHPICRARFCTGGAS